MSIVLHTASIQEIDRMSRLFPDQETFNLAKEALLKSIIPVERPLSINDLVKVMKHTLLNKL